MIDFHSHILPGIDDGSSCVEESVELLKLSKNQGIEKITATPHFYASHDYPEHFFERREKAKILLDNATAELPELPKIVVGAEVSYFEGISDCSFLKGLKMENTPLLLVEMPMCRWNSRMISELNDIYAKNRIVPLIAHIDRYIRLLRDKHIIDYLSGLPVLIQANSSFFLSRKTSKLALSLLSKGKIHLIGSDCHDTTERTQNLAFAFDVIERKLGQDALNRISLIEKSVFTNETSLLEEWFI